MVPQNLSFYPSLSSDTFTVTLQTCKLSPSLSLAHSRSHQPPSPTLLSSVLDATSLSFSLPLYLSSATLTVTFQTCTHTIALSPSLSLSLSLSHTHTHTHTHMFSLFFMQPCSRPLFFYGVEPTSLPLFLYLSPATLTHFTIFCCGRHLPPFLSHSRFLSSATLTHFTLFCWVYSLSVSIFSHVNRHSSDTYTTPISLSLSLALFLSLSLSLVLSLSFQPHSPILLSSVVDATSLPFSLTHSCFLSSATLTHFTLFCWVYSLSVSIFSHVNRHSSDTYITPISLSLSLSLSPANHDMSD